MATKKIIRCGKCKKAYLDYGVGFNSRTKLYCPKLSDFVTKGDGCTFGIPGDPEGTVVRDDQVNISGHETVWGYHSGSYQLHN